MSSELERLLRDVPARVPKPHDRVTRRVRECLLRRETPTRRVRSRGPLALLATTLTGIAIGYWAIPQEEPAIGAPDPPAVTIDVHPRVLRMWSGGGEPLVVAGRVITRRAGERVVVEENVCNDGWNEVAGTKTAAGGKWETNEIAYIGPRANALIRAKWRGVTSAAVTVRVRPAMWLRTKAKNVYAVEVNSGRPLEGRTVQLERYNRSSGRWKAVRRATLRRTSYGYQTTGTFRVPLPKRTIIRAVLPAAQARPCYIAGYSRLETTR